MDIGYKSNFNFFKIKKINNYGGKKIKPIKWLIKWEFEFGTLLTNIYIIIKIKKYIKINFDD